MADPGTLASFNDFMAATRSMPMSGPGEIMNQMSTHKTYASRIIMSGVKAEEYFQGGTNIVEQVQLKYAPNFRNYLPTDTQSPTGSNSLTQLAIPWRFSLVDSVWYDHEIILNQGQDQKSVFKNLAKVKRQTMFTDFWDGVENCLWAQPDSAQMEGGAAQGKSPYSLRCFMTTDGLAPTAANSGATGTWATLETVDCNTFTNFQNQIATYDYNDADTNLIPALNRMWHRVQFQAPEPNGGSTGITDSTMRKTRIWSNLEGVTTLERICKDSNNMQQPALDIGYTMGKVVFHGMPIDYVSAMDAIFTAGQPQFWFMNFDYIKFVFNKQKYLAPKQFNGTVSQPMANVEYRDTWWNLVCTNRREQGVVSGGNGTNT